MKTITKGQLKKQFGSHAVAILDEYLKKLPRAKREQQKYKIMKPLVTEDEFVKLRNAKFKTTVDALVCDAFSEFESLAGELDDWYNNLPESFQQGDKGSQLEDAKSQLEDLQAPDVPEEIGKLELVFIPSESSSSRASRRDDAVSMLHTAIAEMQDHVNEASEAAEKSGGKFDGSEIEDLIGELESAADNADGVDFPGMY